ncbi:MAG: hypothetical protein WAN39_09100 [Candidatus Cybelea sp.]|jgi:hypothetical protein
MRNHPFLLRAAFAAIAISLLATFPQAVSATTTSTFYGITVHVSSQNIKVQNPKTKETMSFLLVPKFDSVFSADGKTTYQMSKIKAGQYVGIIYDRKALGQAHADKIYLLTNANQTIGSQ